MDATECMTSRSRRLFRAYSNEREGDHHAPKELVGNGVLFEGVADGLVIAEEASFEGVVLRSQDDEGESH